VGQIDETNVGESHSRHFIRLRVTAANRSNSCRAHAPNW
jgi:hypothetical protein